MQRKQLLGYSEGINKNEDSHADNAPQHPTYYVSEFGHVKGADAMKAEIFKRGEHASSLLTLMYRPAQGQSVPVLMRLLNSRPTLVVYSHRSVMI